MATKLFTEEELITLKRNPYTYRVTTRMILFTLEFKEFFWRRYKKGEFPAAIFEDCGYNTDILGASRISNFAFRLKEQIESGKGITQGMDKEKIAIPKPKDYSGMSTELVLASMQYELSYLRQEVEFLKKLYALGNQKRSKK